MQLQALFILMASMPSIAYARAVNARDGDEDFSEFSRTCYDMEVGVGGHNHMLEAKCKATLPGTYQNRLDLNKCIRDLYGKLAFQPEGYFGNSCAVQTCRLESRLEGGRNHTWYICMCGYGNNEAETAINLDMGIRNKEGTLECFGAKAEVTELEPGSQAGSESESEPDSN